MTYLFIMKRSVFVFLMLSALWAGAQRMNPPRGRLYNDTLLPSIYLTLPADSLTKLLAAGNECDNTDYAATFVWQDGIQPNDTLRNVGLRLKGNTSRFAKKKSFKISFNAFGSGKNYYDVEKLNLNGAHNDPCVTREKIFWDAMEGMDAPALRCNHVKLFINGAYYGLYINVENLDENFCQSRFGNNDGNLYKCYYGADLTYKGANPNSYKTTGIFCGAVQRVYELQNNTTDDNYQKLAAMINALNNLPADTSFPASIKKYFNVEGYLRCAAVEVASGHWDNYIFNKNNYFLYENTATGQIEYISYDADNTFGIGWSNDDWGTKNVYQFNASNVRPLFTRLLNVPEFRNKFDYYLRTLATTLYNVPRIEARIDSLHNLIWTAAVADTFRTKDYGFTVSAFHNSFTQPLAAPHVKYGLKPFFGVRTASILSQISANNIAPVLYRERHTPVIASPADTLHFSIYALDDDNGLLVTVNYRYVTNNLSSTLPLYDDGLHHDGDAGDHIFGNILLPHLLSDSLYFSYRAVSLTQQTTRYPSVDSLHWNIGQRSRIRLRINELMAKNTSTRADEYKEFDDWLELYNADSITLSIGNYYLSNNVADPVKFRLPAVSMPPGAFRLFWCDNQKSQGPFHTNFKLTAAGEWVGLFDDKGLLMDSVRIANMPDDSCLGRLPDGTGIFTMLKNRTPGYSNALWDVGMTGAKHIGITSLYPNPANTELFIQYENFEAPYTLFDITGNGVASGTLVNGLNRIETGALHNGIYLLRISNQVGLRVIVQHE